MDRIKDSIIDCPNCNNNKLHFSITENVWFCTRCQEFFSEKFLNRIEDKREK